MALQSPFFHNNKRDARAEAAMPPRVPGYAAKPVEAQPVPQAATPDPVPAPSGQGACGLESRLTVGPNIKLKGVEITDCDTLVVEGSVEATMDSRVIEISERGAFKGSAEIDIAEIRGRFDGDLTVREKLTIFSTGKVSGRIRYGKVVIEEGGQLSGEIEFGTAQRTLAPAAVRPGLQQVHATA